MITRRRIVETSPDTARHRGGMVRSCVPGMRPRLLMPILILAAGICQAVPPKVLLLIDERRDGLARTTVIETLARSILADRQIPVLDPGASGAGAQESGGGVLRDLANTELSKLGQKAGADIVVAGESFATNCLGTWEAVATLRAVRMDNGSTMATVSEKAMVGGSGRVAGDTYAIKSAGKAALYALIPAMLDDWAVSVGGSPKGKLSPLELQINGLDKPRQVKAFRRRLREMPDAIASATQREYFAGRAVFDLQSLLKPKELAEQLVSHPPSGIKVEIRDISDGRIHLQAIGRP